MNLERPDDALGRDTEEALGRLTGPLSAHVQHRANAVCSGFPSRFCTFLLQATLLGLKVKVVPLSAAAVGSANFPACSRRPVRQGLTWPT